MRAARAPPTPCPRARRHGAPQRLASEHAVVEDEVVVLIAPEGAHDLLEGQPVLEGCIAAEDVDGHLGREPRLPSQVLFEVGHGEQGLRPQVRFVELAVTVLETKMFGLLE